VVVLDPLYQSDNEYDNLEMHLLLKFNDYNMLCFTI